MYIWIHLLKIGPSGDPLVKNPPCKAGDTVSNLVRKLVPHAVEHQSLHATTTESMCCNKRSHMTTKILKHFNQIQCLNKWIISKETIKNYFIYRNHWAYHKDNLVLSETYQHGFLAHIRRSYLNDFTIQ